jgi:uncharacterized protein (TIGR02145 family)
MKKILFVLFSTWAILTVQAQDYLISFTGTGGSKTAETVKVENLTKDAIITIKGNDQLHLTANAKLQNITESRNRIIDMQYSTGDLLKITGISGIYSTVVMEIPEKSKTIIFEFVECTDGNGNNYPVVKIGTQIWMAENLKTSKFNDNNTVIPYITDTSTWPKLKTPAYCWYDNDTANSVYGALYNWYTVDMAGNGGKKVCPKGWHVPTDAEWTILTDYLGGLNVAGGKMKETGTLHWKEPNTGAGNESGFTALPSGIRGYIDGNFMFGSNGLSFWSTSPYNDTKVWYRFLSHDGAYAGRESDAEKWLGFAIRCIKD